MIQRIQTIYLLLAGLIPAFTFTTPLARFYTEDAGYYLMTALGFRPFDVAPYVGLPQLPWGVLVFSVLLVLIPILTIFKYRNRKRQVLLCNWTVALVVLYYLTYITYAVVFASHTETTFTPAPCAALPLLSVVFTLLARRAIKKDEALVRAADRIR